MLILPPWEAIYATDAERDQSFVEAIHVHAKPVAWYRWCGYDLHEVPPLPVLQRAEQSLQILAASTV